ncbi:hypothetical protein EW026_g4427 [Hermanssonia centrifuga]|uniref:GST C-terminal domain-containing protein n=1 Tax=Hermanssonia centrifuga TaxID=98765 RepID=A0A4S4KH54_9APHY|nr:hypothetical protein EW026_g4427 [Hermanssonia centrifuga]
MDSEGWPFANFNDFPGAENDPFHPESKHLRDVYLRVDPTYAGRFSVPLLWDKKTSKIVNNESSEIIRMFNDAFNDLLPKEKADVDLRPEALRAEVDELVDWMQDAINIGVYKVGFVKEQQAYETAVTTLFEALDRVEKLLEGKDYLIGNQLTEADIRLFVTIVRFDPVYVGLFKCNIRTIRDGYPNIHLWMRKLYWNNPVFKDTCLFDHIKTGYYNSHNFTPIELPRIVPKGPVPDILPL